jgi:hypothetical protein
MAVLRTKNPVKNEALSPCNHEVGVQHDAVGKRGLHLDDVDQRRRNIQDIWKKHLHILFRGKLRRHFCHKNVGEMGIFRGKSSEIIIFQQIQGMFRTEFDI